MGTNVRIDLGSVVKITAFFVLLWVLYLLRDLVLVVLTAVIIASAIEPATRWFVRYRFPRVLAVITIYFVVISIFAGTFYFFLPPFIDDFSSLAQQLPAYLDTIEGPASSVTDTIGIGTGSITENFSGAISIREALDSVVASINSVSNNFFKVISTVFGGVLSFVLIVVISFYLAVQERGIENFLGIITPVKHEKYVVDLWARSQEKIGLWLRGQLLLALIVGVLVYLILTIFGIRYAFLLALIAAMFELIPIFGPILASVPAVAVGFLDGGFSTALIVVAIYFLIQQFENQLFYQLVVKQVVGVPSIIAIIALFAGAQLAGILGMILSIPLAAIGMELLNDLDKEKSHLRSKSA